jgi:multisubunit Na+/H+ antiporter MnhF subunit
MNAWLIAATILLAGLVPCLWVAMRGSIVGALAGLELASTITTLVLLLIAQGLRRDPFMDLALVSSILSFAGALTFVRFLGRCWARSGCWPRATPTTSFTSPGPPR